VLVGQDRGGPVGMGVSTRRPERFRAFVMGNTWAWVMPDDLKMSMFSRTMGTGITGNVLTRRLGIFTNVFIPRFMRRRTPTKPEMAMWRAPHPTPESRAPVEVFPREIMAARPFLASIESHLDRVADMPALLFHADKDPAFGWREVERWMEVFPDHRVHVLEGAGHYWQDDAAAEAVLVIRDWWSDV
jgi:haloalkane dehalogenase